MNLFEDLKTLYKIAGLKGQKVAFIFTDAEVKEESFLEYINQLLMTGEVAGLFPKEEQDALVNDCRPAFKKEAAGQGGLLRQISGTFSSAACAITCTSACASPPSGISFRDGRERFPGLINGCTIDWFLPGLRMRSWQCPRNSSATSRWRARTRTRTSSKLHMGHVHVAATLAGVLRQVPQGTLCDTQVVPLIHRGVPHVVRSANSPKCVCWQIRSTADCRSSSTPSRT